MLTMKASRFLMRRLCARRTACLCFRILLSNLSFGLLWLIVRGDSFLNLVIFFEENSRSAILEKKSTRERRKIPECQSDEPKTPVISFSLLQVGSRPHRGWRAHW